MSQKSRLIQAIITTLLPGLFFTYCLISCAVFCFKLSFILNSLHCFLMFVFLFFETLQVYVRRSVVCQRLDDVGNYISSVIKF